MSPFAQKSFSLCLFLWAILLGCSPETKTVSATAIIVRIAADQDVLAALQSLRVRTARAGAGKTWVERDDETFAGESLKWPVDIVVTPGASNSDAFEVVVDAMAGTSSLVQARALTSFLPHEQRVLTIILARCGERDFGSLCEADPDCYGPGCLSCVGSSCAATPVADPQLLPIFDSSRNPTVDAAQSMPDAATPDAAESDAATLDASMPPPADAGGDAAACEGDACAEQDACELGLDNCDDDPEACVPMSSDQGVQFTCACPTGFTGDGVGPQGCQDRDECVEGTAQCESNVACKNTPGGYTCGDCAAGYSQAAGGLCTDIDECSTNNGGCDTEPRATCNNQIGAPNTCTCPGGYSGNGVGANGCSDTNECATNNGGCDSNPRASCSNQLGAAPICACPADTIDELGNGTRCTGFASFSTGFGHTCAVTVSGGLYCWGYNVNGQLGNNTTTTIMTPTRIGTDFGWTAVSAGSSHTCGINARQLFCWGTNNRGQLGDGTTTERLVPTRIGTSSTWSQVSTSRGGWGTCGIDAGSLYCWGWNTNGEVGDGTTTQRLTPTRVGSGSDWSHVSSSVGNTCGIRSGGALYCWGSGLVGDGTQAQRLAPVALSPSTGWTWITAGIAASCGVRLGELYCWGSSQYSQIGDGQSGIQTRLSPYKISAEVGWTVTSEGSRHACGLRNGALYCWGSARQLFGDNPPDITAALSPIPVAGFANWRTIQSGWNHTCGLVGLRLYCWGVNEYYQLGDGTMSTNLTPTQVAVPSL